MTIISTYKKKEKQIFLMDENGGKKYSVKMIYCKRRLLQIKSSKYHFLITGAKLKSNTKET